MSRAAGLSSLSAVNHVPAPHDGEGTFPDALWALQYQLGPFEGHSLPEVESGIISSWFQPAGLTPTQQLWDVVERERACVSTDQDRVLKANRVQPDPVRASYTTQSVR